MVETNTSTFRRQSVKLTLKLPTAKCLPVDTGNLDANHCSSALGKNMRSRQAHWLCCVCKKLVSYPCGIEIHEE